MSAYLTGYVEVRVNGENLTIDAKEFSLEDDSSSSDDGSRIYGMLHKHFDDSFTLSISTTIVDATVTDFTGVVIEEGNDIHIIEDNIAVEIRHLV